MMKKLMMSLLLISAFTAGIVAISDGNELQKAKELEDTEKDLDKKIQELNKKLERFFKLKDQVVKYTPGQTIFSKGDDYVELTSYGFIPLGYSNHSVGGREKRMRLYFNGEKLAKVETYVHDENFREHTKYESKVTDPNPESEGTEDIGVRTQYNMDNTYDVQVGKMENTLTNPLRLNFKRDFYIPNLTYFEKLFRFTEEYQKRYGTNNDAVTIDTLEKSLDY